MLGTCLRLTLVAMGALASGEARRASPVEGHRGRIEAGFGQLPMRFERNEGQIDPRVRYLARGPGYTMFVTPTEMLLSLRTRRWERDAKSITPSTLRMRLIDARSDADVQGLQELAGRTNYFVGNDPERWRTGVVSYGSVRCRHVYPGVDLVYHGRPGQLEYDFVVAPGADPGRIRLAFPGAGSLSLDSDGNLILALDGGELVQRAPRVYQEVDSTRREVSGRWLLRGESEATFSLGAYDTRHALIIDPVLAYSTYLGGNGFDYGRDIAVDSAGSAYITGQTGSTDFPTEGAYQPGRASSLDAFVTKLSPSGTSLVYSTYLGGNGDEFAQGIAVDSSGSAYVVGGTDSTDFPTQGPFQTDRASSDAFVTKLSPSGDALVYSTYLGGGAGEIAHAITVDASGHAYLVGDTGSTDFPVQNPYQSDQTYFDAFVTKLSPAGDELVYSTYLGGNDLDAAYGIAVDDLGNAYVAGYTESTDFPTQNPYQTDQPLTDAFVTKLSPAGSGLVYSTYLGGNGLDAAYAIALDALGSAYVTGFTRSTNFPTQSPYQTDQPLDDVFVTKLSPSGTSLSYSTYLGGTDNESASDIAVDAAGRAYVTGNTDSADFPTRDFFQTDQPSTDVFVARLLPAGNDLGFSTYLGGVSGDYGLAIAVDGVGNVYVSGQASAGFPLQNPYQTAPTVGTDAFVTKLTPSLVFFTLTPCRAVDTREPAGPFGGPALAAGADRVFGLAGRCGVPATARAVSVNVAVVTTGVPGNLRLYPAGTPLPTVSSINYSYGTRANNAIVSLNTSGALAVHCAQAAGSVHFVLDVSGYFE